MLHKAKSLGGYKLDSIDGQIGRVKEFYFDDQHWAIRYLVADTGAWLPGRQVLIAPCALRAAIEKDRHIGVRLTQRQIEDSPSLAHDKPVSRQFEERYHGYFGWVPYWEGRRSGDCSAGGRGDGEPWRVPNESGEPSDPHLRSTRTVRGYQIHAVDGEIGHVEDIILDDETWAIRYLVVSTRAWWPGKRVLISPEWIDRVSWEVSMVYVNLSRESVRQSPEYTEKSLLNRESELALHRHYKREGYWVGQPAAVVPSHGPHGNESAPSGEARTDRSS